MKYILRNSLLILIYYSNFSFSQTDEQNHAKYWYYRSRFLNDFIKVGLNPGESIPMTERQAYQFGSNDAKYSDGSSWVGYYLGVLATEYYLLKQNNQPTDSVRHELCCALFAFNRLDRFAEYAYGGIHDLNGFFCRDDVDANFIQNNLRHFNFGLNLSPPQQTGFAVGSYITNVNTSDYVDFQNSLFGSDNFVESVDQVSDLIVGLSLVAQFVDASAMDPDPLFRFQDQETSILQEARSITYRIVHFIEQNPFWRIINPVTNTVVGNGGGYVGGFSFPLAQAACRISNFYSPQFAPYTRCIEYNDIFTRTVGYYQWFAIRPNQMNNVINGVIKGNFQAVANSDYSQPTLGLGNITFNLMSQANYWDIEWQTLLRQVLYGGANLVPGNFYQSIIDDAPPCGPYYYSNPLSYYNTDWFCTDRLEHPPGGTLHNYPVHDGAEGEYKGLDYMLYHNLYYIVKHNKYAAPFDMSDRYITLNYPLPFVPHDIGNHQFPLTVGAFETITADDKVVANGNYQSDGDVTFRAGKEITLKPGFEAQYGSDFDAVIQRFTCSSSGYQRSMDSTNVNCPDCYVSQDMFNYPTSYVYYDHSNDPILPEFTEYDPNAFDPSLLLAPTFMDSVARGSGNLVAFPTPSSGQFSVGITALQDDESSATIFVTDLLGNVVFKLENVHDVSEPFPVDLTGKSKGVYYVRMVTNTGRTETVKVLVE